jgi:predicted CoA-substrate-specific enzyme activase
MREIGIDIGSVSVKLAEFANYTLGRTQYCKHNGKPYDTLLQLLNDLMVIDRLAVTGSTARQIKDLLGAVYINEVAATAQGVLDFYPDIRSIIEIGGEDSKLINIKNGRIEDFSSNTICAAGTGIFLDQQARRLCYRIEDLGNVALSSKKPARIAGRCSVFAKSDMIHLQQIGTRPEDLISGLCLALARNFKSVIAKGKNIMTPIAFVGGVAANNGMKAAFEHVLVLPEGSLVVPPHFNCIGAIGAVLCARQDHTAYKGTTTFEQWLAAPRLIKRLPPLNGHKKWSPLISARPPDKKVRAFLGVDIGSISTNLVLIDQQGCVLARKYLWTKGRPIEVVLSGLAELKNEIGDLVEIVGVGSTGSGRYLIGEFIGADLIKNEITAQARGAIESDPEVDTIFEIGGQDSKYISIRNGTIVDFEMNKVCAAGTGSFLEEQAEVLDVPLTEFGNLAINAPSPINLGERCTVFIGSEVIHHQRDANERENLLAGLGYSIAHNYINRVVNGKHIGKKIFFQGGVAANRAVISAFERILEKEITVPDNYDITGAIGIALLVRDAGLTKSRFRGFELASMKYEMSSFICKHCSNECEINKIALCDHTEIFYGGRCERYEEKKKEKTTTLPDLFRLRNEIFFQTRAITGKKIGIPRSLVFYELFPFFYQFLITLGFQPVLTGQTTRKTIEQGAEVSVADTCLPVKVALGHIRCLIEQGITDIFIPSVITVPPDNDFFDRCFVCPYVQTIPYMARAVFGKKVNIHAPHIHFDRHDKHAYNSLIDFASRHGIAVSRARQAIREAFEYQGTIALKLRDLGKQVLDSVETAFVVCSRPYNGYDLGLNLDIPKKIRDLGIPAIPIDCIPIDFSTIKEDFYNMYWHYGQRILAAGEAIRKNEHLFAVYLSNFSCGPDSFLTKFFKEKMGEKPFLLIEIDEHSGDAGFITRCEAFHDSIKGAQRTSPPRIISPYSRMVKQRTIYVPYMCDTAVALAHAMRFAGIDAQVLPFPDEDSILIGRQFTTGRECFPAILTAGDMIKKIRSPDFDPQKGAFFLAQGSGPCRFGQYYKLHRIILDDLGLNDIPIFAPNQGPSLFDDLGSIGIKFLMTAWDGVCAVDALEATSRRIRPYEMTPGATNAVYDTALKELCAALEQGQRVMPVLKKAKRAFERITRTNGNPKPRIGIVGEIYVRSQKYSNNFLEQKLEDLGCEVTLPSIAEWFFYTNFTRVRNCQWFGQHRRVLFTKIFNRYMTWRHNRMYRLFDLHSEARITDLLDHAAGIIHDSFEGETVLTVGKTIEFIKDDLAGVINVMPFTCMPGNIVSTVYKSVKDRYPDFPLFNLSLDGLEHAVDSMRLETFVNQARNYLWRTECSRQQAEK